jgi:hypothetical protein
MANQMNHLPHIQNMKAGFNRWDPVHNSIFDVSFTIPKMLQASFGDDVHLLQEQVTEVSGLEALQKAPGVGEQKFHGVTVSFLNPTVDSTAADITIKFNLNLRNVTDNFVLRLFKEWARLSYDLHNGSRSLKIDYIAESMTIAEANRDGTIWRAYSFKDIMVTAIAGLGSLSYTSNEAQSIDVTFRSDYWEEILATGNGTGEGTSAWKNQTDENAPGSVSGNDVSASKKSAGTAKH